MIRYGKYRFFENEEDFQKNLTTKEWVNLWGEKRKKYQVTGITIDESQFPTEFPAVLAYLEPFDSHFGAYLFLLNHEEALAAVENKIHAAEDEMALTKSIHTRLTKMKQNLNGDRA